MQPALQKQQNKKKNPLGKSSQQMAFRSEGNRIRADGGTLCSRLRLLTSMERGDDRSNVRKPKQVVVSIYPI